MESTRRRELARRLLDHAFAAAGSAGLAGGIYGSTARGEDTAWSDVETLLVVAGDAAERLECSLHDGVFATVRVVAVDDLARRVATPSLEWPITMGVLDALEVTHGDARVVHRLLAAGRAVGRERFDEALRRLLPELFCESWGRVHSCTVRDRPHDLRCSTIEVVLDGVILLCLLNHAWVFHDYFEGVRDAAGFARVPPGFLDLAGRLWLSDDAHEASRLADEYVRRCLTLLVDEGVIEDIAQVLPQLAEGDGPGA